MHNGAMESIMEASEVASKFVTFAGTPEPKSNICDAMHKKVRLIAGYCGFSEDEISFHRAERLQLSSSCNSAKEDSLLKACRMLNSDLTKNVVAVYTPRSG